MILFFLFVPPISCFSSGFLLKLILVHMPFVLMLFLFGIHYLILSGLFLLYFSSRPARLPAVLQTTTTDDDRRQRAKQYWSIKRVSNKVERYAVK